MGAVWLARQRSLGRDVAIKRAKDEADEATARAILAEAGISGRLEHPNIVPVHAVMLDASGKPQLVMKRVEGVSLGDLVDDEEHPAWAALTTRFGDRERTILEVLMNVADALHFAHEQGVFHRDVKPENVMIGQYGEVYLLDWGIAVDRARADTTLGFVGTPAFVAPEMLAGDPAIVDARTDVYLLGATLYNALTGEPRHAGTTIFEVLTRVGSTEAPPYPPHVSPELAALCNRATAFDPDERHPTARALRDDLATLLRFRGSLEIAREIAERLERGGTSSAGERRQLLLEARIGLAQALREHPANALARATLDAALRESIEIEIETENVTGARALLGELDRPAPELRERIDRLERHLAESARLAELGRAEERERDPKLAGRALVTITLLAAGAAMAIISYAFLSGGLDHVSMWTILAMDGTFLGLFATTAFVLRRQLLENRHGRSMLAFIGATFSVTTLVDLFSAVRGLAPDQAACYSLLVIAFGMAIPSIVMTRRFVVPGSVALGCAFWSLAAPSQTQWAVGVGIPFVVLFGIRELRAVLRPSERET